MAVIFLIKFSLFLGFMLFSLAVLNFLSPILTFNMGQTNILNLLNFYYLVFKSISYELVFVNSILFLWIVILTSPPIFFFN